MSDFVSDFREIKERLMAARSLVFAASTEPTPVLAEILVEIRKAINIADEWLGDDA